jgi:hypothetical protein
MGYSTKDGWTDSWDSVSGEDEDSFLFEVKVCPSKDLAHCFVATLIVSKYEPASRRGEWEPKNPVAVHRSEHYSLISGVKAIKRAAKRAEMIRIGPECD